MSVFINDLYLARALLPEDRAAVAVRMRKYPPKGSVEECRVALGDGHDAAVECYLSRLLTPNDGERIHEIIRSVLNDQQYFFCNLCGSRLRDIDFLKIQLDYVSPTLTVDLHGKHVVLYDPLCGMEVFPNADAARFRLMVHQEYDMAAGAALTPKAVVKLSNRGVRHISADLRALCDPDPIFKACLASNIFLNAVLLPSTPFEHHDRRIIEWIQPSYDQWSSAPVHPNRLRLKLDPMRPHEILPFLQEMVEDRVCSTTISLPHRINTTQLQMITTLVKLGISADPHSIILAKMKDGSVRARRSLKNIFLESGILLED